MNFLSRFFKKPSNVDEPLIDQQEYMEVWLDNLEEAAGERPKMLSQCDQLPGATGVFGHCKTNPIPVNGPQGEIIYLNRLRCKNGCGFMWHRAGTCNNDEHMLTIDIYEMVAYDASEWRTLYFSMYHPSRSVLLPEGLHTLSWKSASDVERVFMKTPGFGVTQRVENFPFGLPDAISNSGHLNSITPGLGAAMARRVQDTLQKSKGKWEHRS